MGQILYGTGRSEEARRSFEHAIAVDGRNNEAYHGLAAAYLGLRDYAQAEATYRKAILLRPSDWNGYKALGLFYYEREDYARAADQFQKVVELTPDNAQGFLNLGAAQSGWENWNAAEKAWLRALQLDPKNAGTLSNLGRIYLDRGQNARAIEMYQRSLALNSRSYRAWGQVGRAYLRTGERGKADEALARALKSLPPDHQLVVHLRLVEGYSFAEVARLTGRTTRDLLSEFKAAGLGSRTARVCKIDHARRRGLRCRGNTNLRTDCVPRILFQVGAPMRKCSARIDVELLDA
jgi:tetratricopeptide (TPR) repeat protein